jgi:uncharacterized membrane protein
MEISFGNPLLLLLIPIVIAAVTIMSLKLKKVDKKRKIVICGLRITILVLLILSMSQVGILRSSLSTSTIFMVDQSKSVDGTMGLIEEQLKNAVNSKPAGDKVGMVSFGLDAKVDFIPQKEITFDGIHTVVNKNFTDFESGLKLASALIPAEDKKRIVIISDGFENTGNAVNTVKNLCRQGITVDVCQIKKKSGSEVLIQNLTIPNELFKNQRFDITVKAYSTVKSPAKLKLYADNQLAASRDVNLEAGDNSFVFSDVARNGGIITYKAYIESNADTIQQNNSMSVFCNVNDIPRVLIIQDDDNAAGELVKILQKDANVDVMHPQNLSLDINDLQKYEAFVLANISAEKLNDKFLTNLDKAVNYQGKGLLVTGGADSYALGGYKGTPLEKILPVKMDIKSKEEDPNLGLTLVIDKSGSMTEAQYGVSKLELAVEAAIRSTEVMTKKDVISVLAFDDSYKWVIQNRKVDNLKEIQDQIGTIRPGGGTSILPPLVEAHSSLKDLNTKLKHIILLTDGQAEKTGYDELIKKMKGNGITITTVGIGADCDKKLLQDIAVSGGGRFYAADEFSNIPKIFTKETFMVSGKYINNRTFTPALKAYSEIMKGIDSISVLDGYIGTTAKDNATVVLESDQKDPILAYWQYGLGRCVAWTSDLKGQWTRNWMNWNDASVFWKNIMTWILEKKSSKEFDIKGEYDKGGGILNFNMPSQYVTTGQKIDGKIIGPKGGEKKIEFSSSTPGKYSGKFDVSDDGVYLANVNITEKDGSVRTINSAVNIPYSPEYDIPKIDGAEFLKSLAKAGNGNLYLNLSDVYQGKLKSVDTISDISKILLLVAVFLFMFEVIIKRLKVSFGSYLYKGIKRIMQVFNGLKRDKIKTNDLPSSVSDLEVDQLLKIKKRIKK